MSRVSTVALLLTLSSTVAAQEPPPAAPSSPTPPPAQSSELELFSLESQMEQSVSTSTKTEQRAAQTPAVVTVVTADEIQARGYSSLADVLRAIPGFYDAFDL